MPDPALRKAIHDAVYFAQSMAEVVDRINKVFDDAGIVLVKADPAQLAFEDIEIVDL